MIAADLWRNAADRGGLAAVRAFVFNPGFSVVMRYRLARRWQPGGGWAGPLVRLLGRLAWLSNARTFGCYLSAAARIGGGLALPHPIGIVIGDGSVIGENVTIYQNVTLGRRDVATDAYPRIGDGVIVYAGATLLGGIRIGDGAVIAAHAVVVDDVPAGALAIGAPARIRMA